MPPPNPVQQLMATMTGYQATCVLGAAVELDLFTALGASRRTAPELATQLKLDLRATEILLNALCTLELLRKDGAHFLNVPELTPYLVENSPQTQLPMLRHQMNCLRSWSELAGVALSGQPAPRRASIRGAEADRAAFLLAMDNFSAPEADALVARLAPHTFTHLLDVGGASGTWVVAFLRAHPQAQATLFDLPDAMPHAERRMTERGLRDRVTLRGGDFMNDELPTGADLAWVSAIVHMFSREENRKLLSRVQRALVPGGRVMIRDVVMDPSKTAPRLGALFAVNMLAGTKTGNTFTLAELDEDLRLSGFGPAQLRVSDPFMNSVVEAVKV